MAKNKVLLASAGIVDFNQIEGNTYSSISELFGIGSKALFTIPSDENAMFSENKEAEIISLGISAILIEYLDRTNVRRKMTKPYESLRRE